MPSCDRKPNCAIAQPSHGSAECPHCRHTSLWCGGWHTSLPRPSVLRLGLSLNICRRALRFRHWRNVSVLSDGVQQSQYVFDG
jgi:hypothetical protein